MTLEQLHEHVEALLAERRAMAEHPDALVRSEAVKWLRECGYGEPMQQRVDTPTPGAPPHWSEREAGEDG